MLLVKFYEFLKNINLKQINKNNYNKLYKKNNKIYQIKP